MAVCGSGDGCEVKLERRGLCDRHSAEIRLAWAKIGGSGRKLPPPRPRTRADYCAAITAGAAERREQLATATVEVVREAGEPLTRKKIAAALGVHQGLVGKAAALAVERAQLVRVTHTLLGLPDMASKAA